MALALLMATTVIGIVTANRVATMRWPGFVIQDLHRRISGIAMAFLAIHVVTSVLDTYVHIGWAAIVIPFAPRTTRCGWRSAPSASICWIAVGVTSVLRTLFNARTWRCPLVGLSELAGGP